MAGSEAEERIRAIAVAALRRAKPDARIIHELVVDNYRLDVAAVTPDAITLVEIKSERDVMDRLLGQVQAANEVTTDVRIYVAAKWEAEMRRLTDFWADGDRADGKVNPHRSDDIQRAMVLVERDAGEEVIRTPSPKDLTRMIKPNRVWNLMWAEEMRAVLRGLQLPANRVNQFDMTRMAIEHMSGRQIRRATCAALRQRKFPRADPPC